jgi:SAM-dependent methyltransferase
MKHGINIGCGGRLVPSSETFQWTHLDERALPGVDVVRDLRRGIPFNDSTFDELVADNVLEHFAGDDAIFLINEIHRVLKPGGLATIIVPHRDDPCAVLDPTHKSFYVAESSLYWTAAGREALQQSHVPITTDFEVETFKAGGFLRFQMRAVK